MKKNEAPFAWRVRSNHPLFTSRIIWTTEEKAILMSEAKCIAKNNPVTIWIPRHRPKREPKFHIYEMFEGDGKSTKALFIILNRG